jgi:lipoate---protein ligase
MTRWRVLPLDVAPAVEQLALTESLWRDVAAGSAPATLRWYSYNAPALVLGIGQSEDDIDVATAHADQIEVVKRSSGGAVVFAGPELIALDVALPSSSPLAIPDVVESYRWLGEAFLEALRSLRSSLRVGLVSPAAARTDQQTQRASPLGTPPHARAMACFGVLSPYEVVLDHQRKLIGFSQLRKRGVVLFQVGFYTHFAGARLARFLPAIAGLAEELDARIADVAAAGIDPLALRGAVNAAIEARAPAA